MTTEPWSRPRPTANGYRRDVIAVGLLIIGTVISELLFTRIGVFPHPAPIWLSTLVVAGLTLPLAARRRYPATVAVVVACAFFVSGQFHVPELLFSNISLFLAIYTLGAWAQNRRRADVMRILIIVAMLVWLVVNLFIAASEPKTLPEYSRAGFFSQLAAMSVIQIITNLLYFGAAYVFGNTAWRAARERARLRERTLELAEEREHSAAQAVALERVAIARELHDVVAHHVTLMGVQAGAARRVLTSDPAQSAVSLSVIEASARTAVDELHGLLTTLRETDITALNSSASTLGVEQLEVLVEHARLAGTPTSMGIIGTPVAISAFTSFALYRIAQESLTNTRKHGGADATAEVRLRYLPTSVELEVVDTGLGERAQRSARGLGHLGMRERVAATGGTIEVGPRQLGGYRVRARIPLGPVETS